MPTQAKEGKSDPRATTTFQLVIPLEGFVRSFGVQEQVIKKLVADGVLQAEPTATRRSKQNTPAKS